MKRISVLLVIALGCGGEHRPARDQYNDGQAALQAKDYAKACDLLVKAFGDAGVDPELRYRAAFDLGVAFAEHAKSLTEGEKPDLDQAMGLLHEAAAWFQTANQALPDNGDAKANLAIVVARAQAIADDVNKGKNGLEPRLDRLIAQQRDVRDQAQAVWDQVAAAGPGADPTGHRDLYLTLATTERTLVADAGTIADMAGDEIGAIGAKPEAERKDEEKARLIQLQNLDLYVQEARTALSDARRHAQGLAGELARKSTEQALDALKRAREQLDDPIAVLRSIAQDELALVDQVDRLGGYKGGPSMMDAKAPAGPVPASIAGPVLADRQAVLIARLDEVIARLKAGLANGANAANGSGSGSATGLVPGPSTAPGAGSGAGAGAGAAPQDPKTQALLAAVAAALPSLDTAHTEFDKAREAVASEKVPETLAAQRAGLVAITRALEQFADLRHLIELAWGETSALDRMLGPEGQKLGTPDERARAAEELLARNRDRLARMTGMISEEVAKVDAEAQAAQAQAAQAAQAAQGQPAADPQQQAAAAKQQLARAEELRGQALADLDELAKRLAARGADPHQPSQDAVAKLTELRKLFFSLIEHLQQLTKDQAETRDQTASARSQADDARTALLPGLIQRQTEHTAMAQAIQEALAAEADKAAQAPAPAQPGAPNPADHAKALADAAEEVRQAQEAIASAGTSLTKARDEAAQASYDLQPVLDDQSQAVTHLENALRLLMPPPPPDDKKDQKDKKDQQQHQGGQGQQDPKDQKGQQDQQDQKGQQGQDQQDQQQQQQQQQQGKQGQDDASAAEAQRRAQEVRDGEARRQRERQERQQIQPEPVDKDW